METQTILILLFVVAKVVAIAVQWLAIPYTIALVFTDLVLSLLHALYSFHLTKTLLLNIFLPGLALRGPQAAFPLKKTRERGRIR
jgi:hypothetical protein